MFKLKYNYSVSIKSKIADELLNTYFIRPVAAILVNLIYNTRINPIQVVVFGSVLGFISVVFFASPGYTNLLIGAIFLCAKNISDAVDGQLARAKNMVDRKGRFLDSIADIVINFFVFFALSFSIFQESKNYSIFILGFFAFLSLSIRVSYFVFYLVSYMKFNNKMSQNRIIESVTDEDREGDKITLRLQIIFNFFYGWQDKLIFKIDKLCKRKIKTDNFRIEWYNDKIGLRLNSFIGLGTELTFLILMCILNNVYLYLMINICLLNGYLLLLVLYRGLYLSKKITTIKLLP